VVKVEDAENRSSGAKARRLLSGIYGTTKVVPFQKIVPQHSFFRSL
jgi:hypothetical protein